MGLMLGNPEETAAAALRPSVLTVAVSAAAGAVSGLYGYKSNCRIRLLDSGG